MANVLNTERGITTIADASRPFALERGGVLNHVEIAWESYGELNAERSNAVLLCHALTGNQCAGGEEGWWKELIGPGRALDTRCWFVICSNVLGGRDGSTGPCSIDPATGERFGSHFPTITLRDIVNAQRLLLDTFGISQFASVVGGSMGAMQTLQWCADYPNAVRSAVAIAAGPSHSPWSIAFNTVARQAIALGRNGGDVEAGLRLARAVAMISYRAEGSFAERFGRRAGRDAEQFAVEEWLEHHGHRLAERFDADTYTALSYAMDTYHIDALDRVRAEVLAVGISSDVLYPAHEVRGVAAAIAGAHYAEIDSPHGHDAFLIEFDQLDAILREFFADRVIGASSFVLRDDAVSSVSSPLLNHPLSLAEVLPCQ